MCLDSYVHDGVENSHLISAMFTQAGEDVKINAEV